MTQDLGGEGCLVVHVVFRQAPRRGGGSFLASAMGATLGSAVATSLLLAGCSTSDPRIKTETIAFEVAPNANADNAVAVDLVLVYETPLLASFTDLASTAWFRNRDQLKLANPTGIEVHSFEVMPGQRGPRYSVSGRGEEAVGAFLFASYETPGPHRARIDGLPDVLLRLGEKDFSVAAPPPS
jgi:type VI secretion system protein